MKMERKLLEINPNLEIIIIADANLKRRIADRDNYYNYLYKGKIHVVSGRIAADVYILKYAATHPKSVVISNDQFRQYYDQFKEIIDRRVSFMIIKEKGDCLD